MFLFIRVYKLFSGQATRATDTGNDESQNAEAASGAEDADCAEEIRVNPCYPCYPCSYFQNKSALDIRTNVLYSGFVSEKADFVSPIEQVRHAPLRINRAYYTFLVYAAPPLGRVGS